MAKLLTRRDTVVVLVKSLTADRDSSFLSFLDSGLMVPGSCMVVFTKAKPKSSTNWLDYIDEATDSELRNRLVSKFKAPNSLPCVKMLQPDYYNSLRDLNTVFLPSILQPLSRLYSRAKPLSSLVQPSPTIQKFAHEALKNLRVLIEDELSSQLEVAFLSYQFQPYNISAIKTLLCGSFETPEPIVTSLKMLGMIKDTVSHSGEDSLTKYCRYWALFHTTHLCHQESLTCGNFIRPNLTEKLSQITSNPPSLSVDIPLSMPLHAKLAQWTETRETFHLEYVSYKGQLQVLLGNARRTGDPYGVSIGECKRLVLYRLEKCGYMEEAWCLVARALQQVMDKPRHSPERAIGDAEAIEMDILSSNGMKEKDWDFEFLGKLMNEDALRELLKLGLENRGSIGNVIMMLGGVGMTGAAAAFEGMTGIVAGSARTGIALEIGSTAMVAGTLVTVVAVAAIANYVYVRNQRGKQLAEGGVIGLDFSEFGLEKDVWKAVLNHLDVSSPEQVATATARIESLFKVYEEKFSWDLIEKRRLIDVRFLEMRDIKEDSNDKESIVKSWVNVVASNQKLMHTIVSKLKGRAKNVSGCSFMEHSLVDEYRFFPVTASCCRYLSPSGAKRCIHCNNYFHDSQSNKQCLIDARAVLCKDRMENPEQLSAAAASKVEVFFYDDKSFPVVDWRRLPNSYKRESIRLSAAAYAPKDMSTVVDVNDKENNIRYMITVIDGVAYVVFRGTEPSSSQNWLQNVTFSLTDFEDCTFHSGYFRLCQQILDTVWRRVLDLECSQVIFTGHSLGGGLAHTLHLLCLLTKFETTTLPILSIGFGSPPPFGKKTIKFFDAHNLHGRFITFANQGDPVPMAFKAVEYIEQQLQQSTTTAATSFLSQEFRTALNVAMFVPKVMSSAYGYPGTFIFFDGSVRNMMGNGEQAILWNHEAVSKWLSLTRVEDCAVEKHHVTRYQRFIDFQYPLA
ncbi:hypothetical protein BDR26DRAFT_867224 [Obelidium mucronatum]|nr:hypothetical protein BDR26DRAFT_867224 [Obelidium mucronatum]